jgi:23S rRNA pseudouridine2605 synthase
MAKIRINKALAAAGAASRRGAEDLVRAGRVKVNGRVVTDLATQVDPGRDKIQLDGRSLKVEGQGYYYLYHKPRGEVCTMEDDRGRPCTGTVCAALRGRPRPVGRLDRDSEGLLLLTNDGELANRLTHPRYGIRKQYRVTISPALRDEDAARMVKSVDLDDGPARFVGVTLLEHGGDRSRLEITLDEGRNRLIRRVCETLGYTVRRLKRIRLGTLALGSLKLGENRQLSAAEVAGLKQHLKMENDERKGQGRKSKR